MNSKRKTKADELLQANRKRFEGLKRKPCTAPLSVSSAKRSGTQNTRIATTKKNVKFIKLLNPTS
jgi:hypothetical protein